MQRSSAKSTENTALALAHKGDADAQFGLALKYSLGAVPDYLQAADWYRKAAEQNHGLAQFNLGMMYASGQGVERDAGQSTQWFRKAAQQGDAGAQFQMGNTCQQASCGGPAEEATEALMEACKWFNLAAAQGYRGANDAWALIQCRMTQADITAGNHRAAAFVAHPAIPPAPGHLSEGGPAIETPDSQTWGQPRAKNQPSTAKGNKI